jgi:hypothetical protein
VNHLGAWMGAGAVWTPECGFFAAAQLRDGLRRELRPASGSERGEAHPPGFAGRLGEFPVALSRLVQLPLCPGTGA